MAYHGSSHKGGGMKGKGAMMRKSPSYSKSTASSRQKSGHAGGNKLSYYGKMEPQTQTNRYLR